MPVANRFWQPPDTPTELITSLLACIVVGGGKSRIPGTVIRSYPLIKQPKVGFYRLPASEGRPRSVCVKTEKRSSTSRLGGWPGFGRSRHYPIIPGFPAVLRMREGDLHVKVRLPLICLKIIFILLVINNFIQFILSIHPLSLSLGLFYFIFEIKFKSLTK